MAIADSPPKAARRNSPRRNQSKINEAGGSAERETNITKLSSSQFARDTHGRAVIVAARAWSIALATFVLLWCARASASDLLPPLAEPSATPPFELTDLQGRTHTLADYRGRLLVINFWATWCGPCRAEMPGLGRASEALAKDDIAVVGINVGDDPSQIARFVAQTPVPFPLLQDAQQEIVRTMPVLGLPTTLIINADGVMTHRVTGEREWDSPQMLEEIRNAARAKPKTSPRTTDKTL